MSTHGLPTSDGDTQCTLALEPGLLADIAAGLGASAPIDRLPGGEARRWTCLIEAEQYEALIIAWPAGTGLRMHDHDGSSASLHVVAGQLRERYIGLDGHVQTRWLQAGDTVSLPHDHNHEVINVDGVEAVSIHVYSPPLREVEFRIDAEITATDVTDEVVSRLAHPAYGQRSPQHATPDVARA
ncbi:MAG: cupin domain protein [Ilumatobacteraceae bacterium]|nr:cupin domain protein [Ilumatobacteraceae bacterium]